MNFNLKRKIIHTAYLKLQNTSKLTHTIHINFSRVYSVYGWSDCRWHIATFPQGVKTNNFAKAIIKTATPSTTCKNNTITTTKNQFVQNEMEWNRFPGTLDCNCLILCAINRSSQKTETAKIHWLQSGLLRNKTLKVTLGFIIHLNVIDDTIVNSQK